MQLESNTQVQVLPLFVRGFSWMMRLADALFDKGTLWDLENIRVRRGEEIWAIEEPS